jgi:hypothetical protein
MPNWCKNHLTVRGKRDDVLEFVTLVGRGVSLIADAVNAARAIDASESQSIAQAVIDSFNTSELFSFDGHIPEPEHEGDGWYQWRVANWGTKWDACDHEILEYDFSEDPSSIVIEFNTAWSPPAVWFAAIVDRHQNLEFEMLWNEEQALSGRFFSKAGVAEYEDVDFPEFLELWPDAPYQPWDEEEESEELA